ncbi:glycosyltransferase family 2 protein [Streptosporangium sp. OZ121]|uniref:glycosyltransferase family 2 protein n=1 Tax=Streptosporangium sp. OZ121 TaxID=3444183 RepID=UPI003F78B6AC
MIAGFLRGRKDVVAAFAGADAEEALPRSTEVKVVDLDRLTAPVAAEAGAVAVVAGSPTDLRRVVAASGLLPACSAVAVWIVDSPSWCPPPSLVLPWLLEVKVVRGASSGWLLTVRFSGKRPPGEVVAHMVRAISGAPVSGLPVTALAGPRLGQWRPGDPAVIACGPAGPEPDRSGAPACEVAVRNPAQEPGPWTDPRVRVIDARPAADVGWGDLGASAAGSLSPALLLPQAVPPVDERTVNPRGFVAEPAAGVATLRQSSERWVIEAEGEELARFDDEGTVRDVDVDRLRRLRAVRIAWWPAHTGPLAAVRVVAGLAAAGIPLLTEEVPGWAVALGTDLTDALVLATDADLTDDLRREEHSIRLRRAALRSHGVRGRWGRPAAGRGVSISVLLCTRRPERLPFALAQIGRQRLVDAELILMLHGVDAGASDVGKAVAAFDRPVTVVAADSSVPFGTALNLAAGHARGSVLAKMDDDDWYGPEHLADLALALDYSGADLVGVASEFFYLEQIGVTVRRSWTSEVMADHVAGGAFAVSRSAFDAVGGFRPIPRAVDTQLFTAVRGAGGRMYRAHGLGFMARRTARAGHTWQEPVGYFLRSARRQWRGFRPSRLLESS